MMEWIVSSSVLILIVLALRALLGRRISARLRYALWLVVLLRLLVPVQLIALPVAAPAAPEPELPAVMEEESLYVLPLNRVPLEEADTIGAFVREDGQVETSSSLGHVRLEDEGQTVARYLDRVSPLQVLRAAWCLGCAALLLLLAGINLSFLRRLRRHRKPVEDSGCALPVYAAEGLPSPCLSGLLRPAVYVTEEVLADETALRHVLAHETTHYRHLDHVWSALRCLALAVHWWNPLVWLAVVLSRRDGELACDEGALRRLGDGERTAYGETLLDLVTAKPRPVDLLSCATTMTAGKRGLKVRIQEIACKRKILVSATVAVVLIALVAVGCAFGKGETPEAPEEQEATVEPADASQVQASDREEWDFLLTLEGEVNGHAEVHEVYTNEKTLTFEQVRSTFVSSNMSEIQSLPDFDIRETYIDGLPLSGAAADDFLESVGPEDVSKIELNGITAEIIAKALNDAVGTAIGRKDRESLTTLSFTAVDEEKGAREILLSMPPEEDVVTLTYRYEDGSEFTADLTGGKLIELMRRARELTKEQPSQPDVQATLWSLQAEDLEAENREELAILLHEAAWNRLSRLYDYEVYNSFMTEDWAEGGRVVPLADGSLLRLFARDTQGPPRVYIVHESADRAPAAFFQSEELCGWVMEGEIEDPDAIDVDALLSSITAESLREQNFAVYPNLTAEELAAALNGAVGKWRFYDEETQKAFVPNMPSFDTEPQDMPTYWTVYTDDRTADSIRSVQLAVSSELENTVVAIMKGKRPSGASAKVHIAIEDETLYWLVRQSGDE